MPFLEAAKTHVKMLTAGSIERCIMEFLLTNAVGRHSAVTWPRIEEHLRQRGHSVRQQIFQQGLLKQSREGLVYIGSNDHGPGRGYFLIQDREDAEVIRQWYLRRIQVEQAHLDHLEKLMHQEFD